MQKIQLGIADDQITFRRRFVKWLHSAHGNEIEVVLEAKDGSDLLEQLKFYQPPIILMDISMPVMDGFAATQRVHELYPKIKVIAFTQFDSETNIIEMNKLGVKSFLDKATDLDEIVKAIRIVEDKGMYFPEVVEKIWLRHLARLRSVNSDTKLTDDELELLKMICQGMSSAEIGKKLNKSSRTIDEHRSNLCKKFSVANKEQLIALVSKNHIV